MSAYLPMLVLLVLAGDQTAGQQPLMQVGTIQLPGVEGRIDHLACDPESQRVFVAALGNDTVEVVDLQRNARVQSLAGFKEPQGIAVVRSSGLVAVANGRGEGLQLISSDNRASHTIRLGDDADNVRYDAEAHRIYVGYGDGALAAIDPASRKVLNTVRLRGHPESFQLEKSGVRIFVNVPTAQQLAVIDRSSMSVVAAWPVRTARSNYPLAIDEAGHRAFVGCRQPAKVLVYDTSAGKEITSFAIVGDTDDMFYDSTYQRLYVAGGEGFLDVFDVADGRYARIQRIATASGARTALFVPELGRLILAVPHRGAEQPAQLRVYGTR